MISCRDGSYTGSVRESDVLSSMMNYASGGLKETNEILDEYQDLYEQAAEAELVADEKTV